jgi:hypothetical protein
VVLYSPVLERTGAVRFLIRPLVMPAVSLFSFSAVVRLTFNSLQAVYIISELLHDHPVAVHGLSRGYFSNPEKLCLTLTVDVTAAFRQSPSSVANQCYTSPVVVPTAYVYTQSLPVLTYCSLQNRRGTAGQDRGPNGTRPTKKAVI